MITVMTITADEQIDAVAVAAGITRKQARAAMDAVAGVVVAGLADDRIALRGLGIFSIQHRRRRNVTNPATGVPMEIPARDVIVFKPSKELRTRVEALRAPGGASRS